MLVLAPRPAFRPGLSVRLDLVSCHSFLASPTCRCYLSAASELGIQAHLHWQKGGADPETEISDPRLFSPAEEASTTAECPERMNSLYRICL